MGKIADKLLVKTRYDLATEWNKNNPVLPTGVLGFERDTGKCKVGDGVSTWKELGYNIAFNCNNYETTVPTISTIDSKLITYHKSIAAFYTSGAYTNVHFTIHATIDKSVEESLPLYIELENIPTFDNDLICRMEIGSVILQGFGSLNDVSLLPIKETSKLELRTKAFDNEEESLNMEYTTTLLVGDILNENREIEINGIFSYLSGTDVTISPVTINNSSDMRVENTSEIMYYMEGNINYVQFHICLNTDDYNLLSSSIDDITITLPDELPAIDSINEYVSGCIHTLGLDTIDSKLTTYHDSKDLILTSKVYDGDEGLEYNTYADVIQNSVIIDGTFVYYNDIY